MHNRVGEIPSTIHTASGLMVNPLHLNPEDIRIEDIAHHLGNQCRFSGAVREFYSVGQHSVLCSRIVPPEHALEALMHDAAEAYLQDMARPLKLDPRFGQAYRGAEHRAEVVIAEVFGLAYPWHETIKEADNRLLVTEARDLMHGVEDWSGPFKDIIPLRETISPWSPKRARGAFLSRYHALRKEEQ